MFCGNVLTANRKQTHRKSREIQLPGKFMLQLDRELGSVIEHSVSIKEMSQKSF